MHCRTVMVKKRALPMESKAAGRVSRRQPPAGVFLGEKRPSGDGDLVGYSSIATPPERKYESALLEAEVYNDADWPE